MYTSKSRTSKLLLLLLLSHLAIFVASEEVVDAVNEGGDLEALAKPSPKPTPIPECLTVINGSPRRCCNTTGLCADSSCTVFGFKSSAKANCQTNANANCPLVDCQWINPNCNLNDRDNHCYGTVVCKEANCTDSRQGLLCLQDGNSENFKICEDSSCNTDRDCESPAICNKDKYCEVPEQPTATPTPTPIPVPEQPTATPTPTPIPDSEFGGDNTNYTECERCAPVDGECSKNTQDLQDGRYTLEKDLSQCVDPDAFATALNAFAVKEYAKDPSKVPSYDCARLEDPAGCNTIKCEHYVPDEAVQAVLDYPEFGGMAEIPCREE